MKDAQYWIRQLQLQKHPEGGFFKETYRAQENIPVPGLPPRFKGQRAFSTAIYYLLDKSDCSQFHRLHADEIWHFYAGSPLCLHLFNPKKEYTCIQLGPHPENHEVFQAIIPAGSWFGAHLADNKGFALIGCTVSPGFDFHDFELGERQTLLKLFPEHRDLIEKLTPPGSY